VSGLLRAAAQRVETAGASVDLTPILQAQGQALAALEERLTAKFRAAAGLLATTGASECCQAENAGVTFKMKR